MVKGEVEGDLMIRPPGDAEEETAGGTILMTGRPVIGGVVEMVIVTCHHHTRVGVAMEEEEGTSMTDEGEPNAAKNKFPIHYNAHTCFLLCVCYVIFWWCE